MWVREPLPLEVTYPRSVPGASESTADTWSGATGSWMAAEAGWAGKAGSGADSVRDRSARTSALREVNERPKADSAVMFLQVLGVDSIKVTEDSSARMAGRSLDVPDV